MGNSSSYKVKYDGQTQFERTKAASKRKSVAPNAEIAKLLQEQALATEKIDGITVGVITKHVCNDNVKLGMCMYKQLCSSVSDSSKLLPFLSTDQFVKAAHHFIALISDADQLKFFIKGYAVDESISGDHFLELVQAAYELSHLHSTSEFCSHQAAALVSAAMHNKDAVTVSYLCKWCLQHCHRLVYWMHRHLADKIFSCSFASAPLSSPRGSYLIPGLRSNSIEPGDLSFKTSRLGSTASSRRIADEEKHGTDQSLHPDLETDVSGAALAKSLSVCNLSKDSETRDEADADTPVLDDADASCLTPSLVWLLTCSLPLTYTKQQPMVDARNVRRPSLPVINLINTMLSTGRPRHWEPLYMSDRDGLGMNRFEVHVFNYRGPTLSIFKAQDQDVVFCLALDQEWKDSKNFWGGENCCLLQIKPKYRILERGENLMYFNLTWRGFPTGIQVGDNYESRAMTVDKDMNHLQHHNIPYKLGSIEVWGCGSHEIREHQQEFKKRQAKDVERRRKVKLTSSEWADHPDRCLLQMAGGKTSYADYKTQPSEPPPSKPPPPKSPTE